MTVEQSDAGSDTQELTAIDILKKTRELIDTRGWTQSVFEDSNGCLCLRGALNLTVTGNPRIYPVESLDGGATFIYLNKNYDAGVNYILDTIEVCAASRSIVYYNDYVAKSKDEVLHTLSKAIAIAEQELR